MILRRQRVKNLQEKCIEGDNLLAKVTQQPIIQNVG